MKKHTSKIILGLTFLTGVLFAVPTFASTLFSNTIENETSNFWQIGGGNTGFTYNLGSPSHNATDTFLSFNLYNPDSACLFGLSGSKIQVYSDSGYTTPLGSAYAIGNRFLADGTNTGSAQIPANATTTQYYFELGNATSGVYYQLQPSCYYSGGGDTAHIKDFFHPLSIINNATTTITGIWADNVPETVFGSSRPQGNVSGTIQFQYPTQGLTTPLFSPYLVTVNNLNDPTAPYTIVVKWYAQYPDGSYTATLQNSFSGLGAILEQRGVSIPRTDFGFDFATSTTWFAEADLYANQDPFHPTVSNTSVFIASSSIQFTVQSIIQSNQAFTIPQFNFDTSGNLINVSTSTTTVASQELTVTSSTGQCPAPDSILDVGGGLTFAGCKVSHFLFSPSPDAQLNLQSAIFTFQNTPPMSIFFNLQGAIQSQIGNTEQNDKGLASYDRLLLYQSSTFLGNQPIVLVTSSSLASVIGEPAKTQAFAIMNAGLVIIAGLYAMARIHGRFGTKPSR